MAKKDLEQIVKFDLKELIPLWGLYQVPKNILDGRLSDKDHVRFIGTAIYHGIITSGVIKIIQKLY